MKTKRPKKRLRSQCVVEQINKYPITDTSVEKVNGIISKKLLDFSESLHPDTYLRQISYDTSKSFSIFVSGDHLSISFIINQKR